MHTVAISFTFKCFASSGIQRASLRSNRTRYTPSRPLLEGPSAGFLHASVGYQIHMPILKDHLSMTARSPLSRHSEDSRTAQRHRTLRSIRRWRSPPRRNVSPTLTLARNVHEFHGVLTEECTPVRQPLCPSLSNRGTCSRHEHCGKISMVTDNLDPRSHN